MQHQDLLTKAADLRENHRTRWTKCVRNHRSFFVTKNTNGKKIYIPINYVAFVNGREDADPNAEKIEPKKKDIDAINQVLKSIGYNKVTPTDPDFESVFQDYLLYYTSLPGTYRKDYEEKRRSANGSLVFWTQRLNLDEVLSIEDEPPTKLEAPSVSSKNSAIELERQDTGHSKDEWFKAVWQMAEQAEQAEQTAKQSTGQTVKLTVKNKELRLSKEALIAHLNELLDETDHRCAITGLALQATGPDDQLRPSLDRIDSDGHYEVGNLQVVARFINFWKQATPDSEFRRQLAIVRGE